MDRTRSVFYRFPWSPPSPSLVLVHAASLEIRSLLCSSSPVPMPAEAVTVGLACQRGKRSPFPDPDGSLIGIVTDRDIAIRAVAARPRPGHDDPPVDHEPGYRVGIAVRHDRGRAANVRRLPVIENRRLVGIVSIGDVPLPPIQEERWRISPSLHPTDSHSGG